MNNMDTSGDVNGWKSGLIDMHSECIDDGWTALYLREYSDRQSKAHESAQQVRDMHLAEALTRLQARGEQISLRKLAREAKMAPYPSVQTFLKQQQLP